MPTKLNRAGKQQPYIPEGNGDASGEYADGQGYNVNKPSTNDSKTGTSVASSGKQTSGKVETQPQNQPVKPKQNVPTPAEREKLGNMGIITEDMKSATYTENFAPNVTITRGSFKKEDIGEFNAYLQNIFNEYPEMQRFTNITVRNNTASHRGGSITTYTNWRTGEKNYDLYINSSWLEDRQELQNNKAIKWYKDQIGYLQKRLETASANDKEDIEGRISAIQKSIDRIEEERKTPKTEYGNVIQRCTTRSERLKSLMAHEMMHRITQDFDYGVMDNKITDEVGRKRFLELKNKIREVYNEAINNGDAKKISRYATTDRDEFLSEANAMLEGGYEMPSYITEVVEELKDFNRKVKV